MAKNGQWTFSGNEESFCNDSFDTKEQAILAGYERYDNDRFYIGQIETPGLGVAVDVESIFEHINCNMECGEWSNEYLMNTKPEHDNELEEELCEVIINWIQRHGYQPTFYRVVNIEKIEGAEVRK